KKQKTPKFKGRLIIDKGTLLVTQSESPLLTMSAISLDFQTGKEMIFKAEGNTKQEALIGSFSIHGKREKELEGEGKIVNFPVKGLDSAIGALMPKRRGYLAALLGDTLNATLKAKPTDGTLSISAAIRSPRLLIDLDGVYENEVLKLTRPARGALTVKPLLLKPWEEFALLQNDAQTELNLTSASLPFKHHRPHFEKLAAVGTAKFARGTFLFQDLNEPITLEQFILNFNTDELEKSLDLTLDLSARHKNHPPTAIAGTLTMHHILKKPEFPKMDLKLTNAPLALADAYFKGEASRYLGEMLSGKVAKTKEIFTLSAHTPLLTVDNIRLTLDRSAKLVAPATFQYRPGPALLPELNPGEEIQGTIKTLTIPLKKSALLFNEAAFNLDVLGERLFFTDLARVGGATVTTLKGNLQGTSLKAIQFKGEGDLQLGQNSLGQSLFGNQLKLSAEGKINLDQTLTLSPLLLKLDSPKFNGTIVGAIEDHLFYLKKGIEARFLLEPSQINPLLAKGENLPQMSAPTQMLLEVESGQFPLSEEKHSELSLKGSGKIQEITLRGSQTAFEFQDVVCKFDFDGKKEVNALRFEGTTLEGKAPAGDLEFHLKGKGKISELLSSPAQIALSLSNFSSKVADILFQTKGNLPSIVGQNLDFSLSMDKKDIDLTLSSPLLEIDGAFLAGDYLELRSPRKPLKIHWKMSEAGFIALRRLQAGPTKSHSPLFDMEGTSQIKLDVSSLQLPLEKREGAFPKVNFNLYKSAFDSKIRLETLHLKQKRAGLITKLERFDFSIAKKNIGEAPLFFKFSGEVSPFGAGGGGDIQGQGTLKNFLSPSKALDLSNVSTSVHAKLKNIPSVFIDALTQLDQGSEFPPSAFLGSLIDAQFDAEIDQSQGSITMDIDASACRARFAGRVSDGILSLSEPLQAIFTVTPEFNTLLKRGGGLVALVAFPGNSYHYLTDLSGIFPSHKISPCLMDNVVDFERRKPTKNLGATSGRNFRERPLALRG
ncbi:MAG: hypothetical protein KDK60_00185, partial [Chlamydiia bacterium]|nr:hypothetical protein [Chlamydiia bacterium]